MFPFSRRGTFYGGVFLPNAKAATENRCIESMRLPERLVVPLPDNARILVDTGSEVERDQRLAQSPNGAMDAYSPVCGKVGRLTAVDTAYRRQAPGMELLPRDDLCKPPEPQSQLFSDWENLSAQEISGALQRGSVIGQGGKGRPTVDKIMQARQRGIKCLIVNGMESEPCLTADYRVLSEYGELVVHTLSCLHRYLGVQSTYLALDDMHRALLDRLSALTCSQPLRVVGLRNRYPQGFAPLLILALLGREVPAGQQPIDIGVVVLNVSTVFHIGRLLAEGTPQTARVVTVSGDAVRHPGNYWIPMGTPVRHVLDVLGISSRARRIVVGGPMTGRAVTSENTVLTTRCQAVLVFSAGIVDQALPSACVHCGWCEEVCPVRLPPSEIYKALELDDGARAQQLHVGECIACGLCSYVCPSALPLADALINEKVRLSR